MGVIDKLKGTSVGSWLIGLGSTGVLLKNDAGSLDVRDAADAAFLNVSVLTPTAAEHAATKGYVDGVTGAPCIRVPFAFGDAGSAVSSTAQIPSGAYVHQTVVVIDVAFDVDVTIEVGITADSDQFSGVADNDSAAIDAYWCRMPTLVASADVVDVTLGAGAPTAGSGYAIVYYCEAQS